MSGVPNLQEFGLYNWRGGGGSMWFAPVSQARGSECDKQQVLASQINDIGHICVPKAPASDNP